jgi:hypothetical protein
LTPVRANAVFEEKVTAIHAHLDSEAEERQNAMSGL